MNKQKITLLDLGGVAFNMEDMIFIDDSPGKIVHATECGIRSILYHDNEQIKRALKIGM